MRGTDLEISTLAVEIGVKLRLEAEPKGVVIGTSSYMIQGDLPPRLF